jgi:hypothetical protein
MTREEVERRYPRLLRCMRDVAILSRGEAISGLADRINYGWDFSGEAINHYGGILMVIRNAIQWRHQIRKADGGKFSV